MWNRIIPRRVGESFTGVFSNVFPEVCRCGCPDLDSLGKTLAIGLGFVLLFSSHSEPSDD